jgi:polar amino acid transport system substrate-binding protein
MDPLPAPDQLPANSLMQHIRDRGKMIVAVDEETAGLSARNPVTGELEGLEIDLLNKIAEAIFGDTHDRLQFKTVTPQQKIEFPKTGRVDIAASAISMSCERWQDVAFTSEYFQAELAFLVRNDSPVHRQADLAGRRVCMPTGSSTIKTLEQEIDPGLETAAVLYLVDARQDCLVALQEGKVDAYLGHDTFVRGMADEDPQTRIVPQGHLQHYGMAVNQAHPEFVRFVNGVLEQLRRDGSLQQMYADSFDVTKFHPTVPATVATRTAS